MDSNALPRRANDAARPLTGISTRVDNGLTILSPASAPPLRRVLYVNSYGGASIVAQLRAGFLPAHHLWGCLDLVRKGYEVAVAEPLPDFYLYRKPLPHDLRLLSIVRTWLGNDGIVYCGHNVLYWLPLLRALGAVRSRIVSLLFAREPLHFSNAHAGIIALTQAGAEQARALAPRAKVAKLGWGVDLDAYPSTQFRPLRFMSCGITLRDHETLSRAAAATAAAIRVTAPASRNGLHWPSNVSISNRDDASDKRYEEWLIDQYEDCIASLIILRNDPIEYTAVGMTNLLEAMAMRRAAIVTRTGALPTEIDVERLGCGVFVPPNDPKALAVAIESLASDPDAARTMGERGRALCENHYNIRRYAEDLHQFFETL